MQDLQSSLDGVLDYIRGIWIKKRYVMIASWLIIPVGLIYVSMMPDVYRSEAKIFIDTGSELDMALRGLTFEENPNQKIAMMVQTLKSRDNLEKIARGADLDITAASPDEYNALLESLSDDVKLLAPAPRSQDNVYTIYYVHREAVTARNVVQETLDIFVEGALGESRAGNTTANRFLDEQIVEYELRLSQSEQQMADFQRRNADLLPVSGTFYSRLGNLQEELDVTRLQIDELTKQKETFLAQLQVQKEALSNNNVQAGSEPLIQTRYDARIVELEASLDQLKIRFTDLHPEVVETSRLLDSLRKNRDREIESFLAQQANSVDLIQPNQISVDIRSEINRVDGEIASLQVREESFLNKITELRTKIDLVPQLEAEQVALNRDYEILKQNYLELLSRRESADLSQKADVSAEDFQFRIIEPPMVPIEPDGPNRLVFYTLVLLIGFGAGIGIAFIISQFSPILIRASQLRLVSDFPVLGAVSHLNREVIAKKARIRLFLFILSSGALIAMYGTLMVAELLRIDVMGRLLS